MNKPTLAFVDHSYHKRTKSTHFLREVLNKDFSITDLWDETWEGGSMPSSESINKYDCVLFFQVLPEIKELRKIKAKIIWVPMYDAVVWWPETKWELLKTLNLRIISFSNTITKKLKGKGFDVMGVNVYLDPSNVDKCKFGNKLNIFYWQRTNIEFEKMINCLPKDKISKIVLKIDPDPGYKKYIPSNKLRKSYHVKVVEGDIPKEKYIDLLKTCNVYIAPRKIEGIGWSFIEAMTMGMAVIAINAPTMNQYISNNVSGILYDPTSTTKYSLQQLKIVGDHARNSCVLGYNKWVVKSKGIPDYIKKDEKRHTDTNNLFLEDNLYFKIKHYIFSYVANIKFKQFKRN